MTKNGQPLIVLLGMHRSGTSLMMSVLNSLGVRCGNNLIPAGPGNEMGFWEHAGIVAAHEQLLADLNRTWHGPKGTFPLPDGWLDTNAAKHAKRRLVEVVTRGIAEVGHDIWGFKDPRTCRLLPLWKQVFDEIRIEAKYILTVRNPAAVCASLKKHNGMGRGRSELAWLQYNLESLEHVDRDLLLVIDYDRLVEQTAEEVGRLAASLSRWLTISAAEKKGAIAQVSLDMRRSAVGVGVTENPIVAQAYGGLSAMARGEEPDESFRWLLANFSAMGRLFQPWENDRQHQLLDWAGRMIVRRKYR